MSLKKLSIFFLVVTREHVFKDKPILYQFWQDEEGAGKLPSPKELAEAVECLPECLAILAKRAPDAALRMMLRKPYVLKLNTYRQVLN